VSDNGLPAVPRLVSINRQQLVLRSIDVEQLIDEDHSARLIWQLIGRLDLGRYHAQIEAVEGRAGREHTDPHLLISLWTNRGQEAVKKWVFILHDEVLRRGFPLLSRFGSSVGSSFLGGQRSLSR
jgi:hypothetical protein